MRGDTPVPGAKVLWRVVDGNPPKSWVNNQQTSGNIETFTDTHGLAEITWSIDAAEQGVTHRIEAVLPPDSGPATTPPVQFTARFDSAATTSFRGKDNWPPLRPDTDVKTALDTIFAARSLLYRGGDGQSVFAPPAAKKVELPQKLRVAVMRGDTPVKGATVCWRRVNSAPGGAVSINNSVVATTDVCDDIVTTTDANGLAEITWSIDAAEQGVTHRIEAVLLTELGLADTPPVQFTARFDSAATTSYEASSTCPSLAGITNVQAALDALCKRHFGTCTIEAFPGENLQARLNDIPDYTNIRICLAAGRYELDKPLRIEKKGAVVLEGAGFGTLLVAPEAETALFVKDCASITIRDCAFEGGIAGPGPAPEEKGLGGSVFVSGCREIRTEACEFRNHAGAARFCFGLSVIGDRDHLQKKLPVTKVWVSSCTFGIGHWQGGILVRDAMAVRVRHNHFEPRGVVPKISQSQLWARIRRTILGRISVERRGKPLQRDVKLIIGGKRVGFTPGPALSGLDQDSWSAFVNSQNPPAMMREQQARNWFAKTVEKRFSELGSGLPLSTSPVLAALETALLKVIKRDEAVLIADAVVIAGAQAVEVQVEGNTMSSVLRGVTVATSARPASAATPVGRVLLAGNAVELAAHDSTERRFGLFVGNSESGTIRDNRVMGLAPIDNHSRLEGVRVWGRLGSFVLVRDNHISGSHIGVRFVPINVPAGDLAWIITHNLAKGARNIVLTPFPAQLRGLGENWN